MFGKLCAGMSCSFYTETHIKQGYVLTVNESVVSRGSQEPNSRHMVQYSFILWAMPIEQNYSDCQELTMSFFTS